MIMLLMELKLTVFISLFLEYIFTFIIFSLFFFIDIVKS